MSQPEWYKHFIAGNVGGIFGLTLAYPLDTVKVRLQTRPADAYKGLIDCFRTMVRTEGVGSLYRGIASPVIGYGLIKSTAFGSYNQCKTFLQSNKQNPANNQLNLLELTLCGGYAGLIQTFVRCPVEQIKVVMQARNRAGSATEAPYKSTWNCVVSVYRTEGLSKGFYRSFIPTLSREIPQYAIYYPTYEVTKAAFIKLKQTALNKASSPDQIVHQITELGPLATAIAGGTAGVAQWVPTYALDVIKSRVSAAEPGTYRGFLHCAQSIYKQEGMGVFFRGLNAAVIRAFPLHGAVFLGYELSMKFMK